MHLRHRSGRSITGLGVHHILPMNRALIAGLSLALSLSIVPATMAQTPAEPTARLRDAPDFDGAIRILSEQMARDPSDRVAARMLAQTLYWAGRREDARRTYEIALQRHPEDYRLRLDYGRMLMETGDYPRARAVVTPVRADVAIRPWADALLGTIAYWEGDYTGARRLLRAAVAAEPSLDDARRQLGEIAAVGAPWVSTALDFHGDDQPLTRSAVHASAGIGLTPLISLYVDGSIGQVKSGDSLSLATSSAAVGFSSYMAAARLETEGRIGTFQRGTGGSDWTGRGRVGLRLPGGVTLSALAERRPYLHTVASIRRPIVTDSYGGTLALAPGTGWLGEAGVQRTIFPDRNGVTAAHGWLLAPLVRVSAVTLRAGYGASVQDSDQSRFAPVVGRPIQSGGTLEGVYSPYYTPLRMQTHSVLGDVDARLTPVVRARIGGSYGLYGIEHAPAWRATPPSTDLVAPVHSTEARRFSPWAVRGALELAPSGDLTVGLGGEAMSSAFYTAATARVHLTYRFASSAARRATRL
jgi:hypothetical protein